METKNQKQEQLKNTVLHIAAKTKETVKKIIENADLKTCAELAIGFLAISLRRPAKNISNNFITFNLFHF